MTIAVSEISIGRLLLAHARAFIERFGTERPTLGDDLAGTGRRLYGLLPNMTYLIGRDGRVLFRADWTDPPTIKQAIRYVSAARGRRREGLSLKPFYAELLGYRWSSQPAFMAGLELAGPRRDGALGNRHAAERADRPPRIGGGDVETTAPVQRPARLDMIEVSLQL